MAAILRQAPSVLCRGSKCVLGPGLCLLPAGCSTVVNSCIILSRNISLSGTIHGVTPMELLMPALSPTMEVGTIKKWLKEEGEAVAVGDALCEVETDKATVTMDADEDGVIAKILVAEGTSDIRINTLIALMVAEGENYKDVDIPSQALSTPEVHSSVEPSIVQPNVPTPSATSQALLSPAVRYLIDTNNLDANKIKATGPKNRILKGDVLKYMSREPEKTNQQQTTTTTAMPLDSKSVTTSTQRKQLYEDLEVSNMRKVIARRLTESKSTVPHTYATIDCTIDGILKLRKSFVKDKAKLSVNDFVIKAAAMALKEHPDVNSQLQGNDVVHMPTIDISVAVATDQGLITPIVTNAAKKGLKQISDNVRDLASRARAGKLQLHEFQGGSFSISNLGMFGIGEFSAVINPPQSCILAVGSSKLRLSESNQTKTIITLTLSSDARVVDDALSAAFLQSLKSNLENPSKLGLL